MKTIPARGFQQSTYEARLALTQTGMSQSGIDTILLTTEFDIRYYTGFFTQFWQSPTRPWYLLIPAEGAPVAVIPKIGEACMGNTWITDIRTWSSPDPKDDGVSLLANTLMEQTSGATIGIPMGAESHLRMPLNDFTELKTLLTGYRWADATAQLNAVRRIKCAAEVEKIEYVCQIASSVFAQVPDLFTVGMTEMELFKRFKLACIQAGVDDVSYLVGCADQNGYDDIISPAGDRKTQTGDILILDTGCTWDGYYCDFDRNFAFGEASTEASAAYERLWDATQAALDIAKPGTRCSDLYKAMSQVMYEGNRNDEGSVGRLGHGLGMQLTETPSITAYEDTPLEAGMVMTLEPGYSYAPGKMMVHEENIVIESNGARLLTTRASKTLPIIT